MLKKNLEQREKPELIAIIQHMLRQEPELQWLLMTPLPTVSSRKSSVDPEVYRQQVLAAMAAGESQRKRKRGEVERRLTAIKTIADEFAAQENYAAALTIYEVLITEVIEHFNDYRDEYVAFCVILIGCIDGLDEDIAGLLVGNTSPEERQVIAGWAQDALEQKATWSSGERYEILLAALERVN